MGTEETDPETGRIVSLDSLNAKVEQLFDMLKGKGDGEKPAAGGGKVREEDTVADQVKAEIERLKASEAAAQSDTDTKTRLATLEDTLKGFTEKKPKEHRKVTRFMWGDKDDE